MCNSQDSKEFPLKYSNSLNKNVSGSENMNPRNIFTKFQIPDRN